MTFFWDGYFILYVVCVTFGTRIFLFSNGFTNMSSLLEVDYKWKYLFVVIILTDLKLYV